MNDAGMAAKESEIKGCVRRAMLRTVVGALVAETGFISIEPLALESLTEMLQAFIYEVGRSSKAYCEVAGRTVPFVSDITLAMIEMGIDIDSIIQHARRPNKTVLLTMVAKSEPSNHPSLQTGQKIPHPQHIPEYLPAFPDPHTFVRTPTHKQPVSNYQAIREKAAAQKRDVERALTRFIAKTGNTHSVFHDDTGYPLISCTPSPLPYAAALLSKDHDIDALDLEAESNTVQISDTTLDPESIDNPYLRPAKLSKAKKK